MKNSSKICQWMLSAVFLSIGLFPLQAEESAGDRHAWKTLARGEFSRAPADLDIRIDGLPIVFQKVETVGSLRSELGDLIRYRFSGTWDGQAVTVYRTVGHIRGRYEYVFAFEDYPDLGGSHLVERALPWNPEDSQIRYMQDGVHYWNDNPDFRSGLVIPWDHQGEAPQTAEGVERHIYRPARFSFDGDRHRVILSGFGAPPRFRVFHFRSALPLPEWKWTPASRTYRMSFRDQVDEFVFGSALRERIAEPFALVRQQGEHAHQILDVESGYQLPERVASTEAAPPTVLAHWSFDGIVDNRVPDVSGNRHHGQLRPGGRLVPGVSGLAYDGTDSPETTGEFIQPNPTSGVVPEEMSFGGVTLPASALAGLTDHFAISFWYRQPPRQDGYWHYHRHYNEEVKAHPETAARILWVLDGDGKPMLNFRYNFGWRNGHHLSGIYGGQHRIFGIYGPTPNENRWTHMTLNFKGDRLEILMDGTLKTSGAIPRPVRDWSAADSFGIFGRTWARIDELRIHDRPLSPAEIQAAINQDTTRQIARPDLDALTPEYLAQQPGSKPEAAALRGDAPIGDANVRLPDGLFYRIQNARIVKEGSRISLHLGAESGTGSLTFPAGATVGIPGADRLGFSLMVRPPAAANGEVRFTANGLDLRLNQQGIRGSMLGKSFQAAVDFPPQTWSHLAVTYFNGNFGVWFDGERVVSIDDAFPQRGDYAMGIPVLSGSRVAVRDPRLFNCMFTDQSVKRLREGGSESDVLASARTSTGADPGRKQVLPMKTTQP